MEATMMDAAAQTSAPATETPGPKPNWLVAPVAKAGWFLRWIWWFDLGAVALAGGQAARLVKAVVEKGKEVEPAVIKPFKKAESAVGGALGEVGSRLKPAAKPLGQPEQGNVAVEMRELSDKVNELAQRIETLQARRSAGVEDAETMAAKAGQK